jgi:hypothetical protein
VATRLHQTTPVSLSIPLLPIAPIFRRTRSGLDFVPGVESVLCHQPAASPGIGSRTSSRDHAKRTAAGPRIPTVKPTVPIPSPTQVRFAGQGPIVTATLRSVIFGDGQFVAVDEQGAFEQFGKKLKAIIEVAILAKTQAWNQVEALCAQRPSGPPPSSEDPYLDHFPSASRDAPS